MRWRPARTFIMIVKFKRMSFMVDISELIDSSKVCASLGTDFMQTKLFPSLIKH